MRKFVSLAILLIFPFLLLWPEDAHAANLSASGLTISPAIVQVNLSKGQTQENFSVHVANNTQKAVIVYISTQDFSTLGDNGSIFFLNNELSSGSPHGLASWIRLGFTQVAIAAGGSQAVPVTIQNVDQLSPGGHYAAINFEIAVTPSTKVNNITSNEEVSSLVFLTTYGQSTQSIKLSDVALSKININIPESANIVFANTGNTQTAPRGLVTITNSSGKEVARGIIDVGSGLVLPSTVRLYNVPLHSESKHNLPGEYHLRIEYQANGVNKNLVYTKGFFVVTQPLVNVVIVLLIVGLVVLVRRIGPVNRYKAK